MDSNLTSCARPSPDATIALARRVLRIEAEALRALAERVGTEFVQAVDLLLRRQGRVIVCGIGKSGHIARKLAATLASTGTPAYFVHAAEAAHGDLGMITEKDVVIALSNSGTSEELLTIVPLVKRQGAQLIAMTGNPASPLATAADVHLDAAVQEEACPLNLAPTASTAAALALGDALAVALLEARGFGREDFARSHPGGALGRRLLTHVRDVMRPAEAVPQVAPDALMGAALLAMSQGGMGMTVVRDAGGSVAGIFTDGDLRRALERIGDLRETPVSAVMTRKPRHIGPDELAGALTAMLLVFALGRGEGAWTQTRLLLTGVIVAAGCGAVVSLLLALAPDTRVHSMLFWLMGDASVAARPWPG